MRLGDDGEKFVTVAQLREVLSKIPDDFKVGPNRVGNMAVLDAGNNYVGFVDFIHDGEYTNFHDNDALAEEKGSDAGSA